MVSSGLGRCWQLGSQDKIEALLYPSFPEPGQWLQQVLGFRVAICFVCPICSCGDAAVDVCLAAPPVAESAGSDPARLGFVGQALFIPGFWRFVPS